MRTILVVEVLGHTDALHHRPRLLGHTQRGGCKAVISSSWAAARWHPTPARTNGRAAARAATKHADRAATNNHVAAPRRGTAPVACLGAQQRGGEDDGVEGHVVLAHELNQLYVLRLGGNSGGETIGHTWWRQGPHASCSLDRKRQVVICTQACTDRQHRPSQAAPQVDGHGSRAPCTAACSRVHAALGRQASRRQRPAPQRPTHLRVLPPRLPALAAVVGGDGDVADGGVEPDVEDLRVVGRDGGEVGCGPWLERRAGAFGWVSAPFRCWWGGANAQMDDGVQN